MKKIYLILALLAGTLTAGAQTDAVAKEVAGLAKKSKETVAADSAKPWKFDGMLSLTASQTSLKNWAAPLVAKLGALSIRRTPPHRRE